MAFYLEADLVLSCVFAGLDGLCPCANVHLNEGTCHQVKHVAVRSVLNSVWTPVEVCGTGRSHQAFALQALKY